MAKNNPTRFKRANPYGESLIRDAMRRRGVPKNRDTNLLALAATALTRPECLASDLIGDDASTVQEIVHRVTEAVPDLLRRFRYNAPLAAKVLDDARNQPPPPPESETGDGEGDDGDDGDDGENGDDGEGDDGEGDGEGDDGEGDGDGDGDDGEGDDGEGDGDGDGDGDDGDGGENGDGEHCDDGDGDGDGGGKPSDSETARRLAHQMAQALAENEDLAREMGQMAAGCSTTGESGPGDGDKTKLEKLPESVKQSLLDVIEGGDSPWESVIVKLGEARKIIGAAARLHAVDGMATTGFKPARKITEASSRDLASLGQDGAALARTAMKYSRGQLLTPERRHYSPSGGGDFLIMLDASGSMFHDQDISEVGNLYTYGSVLALAAAYEAIEEGRHVVVVAYSNDYNVLPVTGNPAVDLVTFANDRPYAGSTDLFATLSHIQRYQLSGWGFGDFPDCLVITDGGEMWNPDETVQEWMETAEFATLHLIHAFVAHIDIDLCGGGRWTAKDAFHFDTGGDGKLPPLPAAQLLSSIGYPFTLTDLADAPRAVQMAQDFLDGRDKLTHHNGEFPATSLVSYDSMARFFRFLIQETDWCGIYSRDVASAAQVIARAFGA